MDPGWTGPGSTSLPISAAGSASQDPKTDEEAARSWDREGAAARRYRPMLELPQLQGVTPWYFEWMRHPPGDSYWSFARLGGRYGRVDAAVLNLSGWFDEMYGPAGAVENFQGAGDALVLGPWTHGVASVQRSKAGERDFGPSAALDYVATVLGWMDRYLKGDSLEAQPTVRVFVMGANQWRTSDRWPLAGVHPDTFYLASSLQGQQRARGPGAPGACERRRYNCDSVRPRPSGHRSLRWEVRGARLPLAGGRSRHGGVRDCRIQHAG